MNTALSYLSFLSTTEDLQDASVAGDSALASPRSSSIQASESTKDHIIDKVIEKILAVSIPVSPSSKRKPPGASQPTSADPDFSLAIMASNIRKLNSRAGILLVVPSALAHILSWDQPALTLSVVSVYTYACFYPFILTAVPATLILIGIMAPGYDKRHPMPSKLLPTKFQYKDPLEAEAEESEMKELVEIQLQRQKEETEKVLMERLRDLQNMLGGLVKAMDAMEAFVIGVGSFANEAKSTALYLFLLMALFSTLYIASFVPTNIAICSAGWIAALLGHPVIQERAIALNKAYWEMPDSSLVEFIRKLETEDVILDFPPEEREVELFELQRVGLTPRQWTPWVFTPIVYEMQSPLRISMERPPGTRFMEDVEPPEGWFFKDDSPWEVDKCTKAWVAYRGIRNVELDLENAWAYDYKYDERGEWRRRRWLRKCYRYGVE